MRRLFVSAAVVFVLAAPLAAQARMPSPETIFKAWDKNKDGGIDKTEWAAAGRKPERFALADANSDGKVSLEELKVGMARMKAAKGQ
jgi:Ca2+-binding EF-hand superfamily protein